jgi:hypothetical protein
LLFLYLKTFLKKIEFIFFFFISNKFFFNIFRSFFWYINIKKYYFNTFSNKKHLKKQLYPASQAGYRLILKLSQIETQRDSLKKRIASNIEWWRRLVGALNLDPSPSFIYIWPIPWSSKKYIQMSCCWTCSNLGFFLWPPGPCAAPIPTLLWKVQISPRSMFHRWIVRLKSCSFTSIDIYIQESASIMSNFQKL